MATIFVWLLATGSHGAMSVDNNPLNTAPKLGALPGDTRAPVAAPTATLGFHTTPDSKGMPTAAASEAIAAERGMPAPKVTSSVPARMLGIPSPAAAAAMAPQTLPLRPKPDVTLPTSIGERDSHSVDTHYGLQPRTSSKTISEPAVAPGTPGDSISQAEEAIRAAQTQRAIDGAGDQYPNATYSQYGF
jgi:hypothetical protein